ncbi:MAG: ribonuclease T [Gammaproteobacteria bacterium]|nr:ribonuclease T [Gammaproteobacteria bacterium]
MADRFRGFLPVVVDVETAGFNPRTDALLEIAAVIIEMDEEGMLRPGATHHAHVEPFPGANLEQSALDFTGIDPYHPFRMALQERDALGQVFSPIRKAVKHSGCTRAVMVAHNPIFDMGFVNAAVERCGIKRNPFHPFSSFDTVTLGGLAYGQTVLARIAEAAGMKWNENEAHSAVYDAERTAEIFCTIVNRWEHLARLETDV